MRRADVENRKGRRDWRSAARLGFFCGFSNRAGEPMGRRDREKVRAIEDGK
jgi:hypothetical protein